MELNLLRHKPQKIIMTANVQKVENIWLLWGKKISVFEKNNRIIKQVMFYYSSLRAFWVSNTEGNLWIINLLFVEAKAKKKPFVLRQWSWFWCLWSNESIYKSSLYFCLFYCRHHFRIPTHCLQILFAYISSKNRHLAAKSDCSFGGAKFSF